MSGELDWGYCFIIPPKASASVVNKSSHVFTKIIFTANFVIMAASQAANRVRAPGKRRFEGEEEIGTFEQCPSKLRTSKVIAGSFESDVFD